MRCKDVLFVMRVGDSPISSLCFKPGEFSGLLSSYFVFVIVTVVNLAYLKQMHNNFSIYTCSGYIDVILEN